MRPKNFTERKKRILTFAGLYAASVILIFFIFSAFGVRLAVSDQRTVPVNEHPATAGNELLQADSLLHTKLQQLQQSDDIYTLFLADTASASQRNNAAAISQMYELALKKAIDSIDQAATGSYGSDQSTMYKTMLNSFRSVVNSREALKGVQASIRAGKTSLSSSQHDILQWKTELAKKDNELARMDAEIKTLQGRGVVPSKSAGTDEAQKGENELLKTAFNDQLKELNDFKEKYNRLKSENGSLASQVVEYKRAATSQAGSLRTEADNKINTLEQKVADLNAEVYFAKIDCNLTRADAQQIISNARQRKELLSASLEMLNTLAASGDAGIQKKAKEKIVHLNHIATTLHD